MKLIAKCPHCGKQLEAEITFSSATHHSMALRRLDRQMQPHMQICFKNPRFGKMHEATRYEVEEIE